MYPEKNHKQTQSIIIFIRPERFSNSGLKYRFLEGINCILALTFLAVDTLINIWRENIPNFVTLKTFGLNMLIALAHWQRFDPTCKKYRNLMSKWLICYLQIQLGIGFCHNIVQPLASNQQSIPHYTIWRKKNNSKKASAHTLFWQRHV